MQQVMPRRRAQPLRQPAAHVRAPVNFLKRDVVERETREYSRGPAVAENPLQNQKWRSVGEKKRDHSPGIAGKIDVPGRVRRIQRGVMHHVLLAKDAAPRVQKKSVQTIFETVGVEKTQRETAQDSEDGMRKKAEGDSTRRAPDNTAASRLFRLILNPWALVSARISLSESIQP